MSLGKSSSIGDRARSLEDMRRYREEMEYWQRTIDGLNAAAAGSRLIKTARWTR